MADKVTILLPLAIKAADRLKADHFHIKSAYIHEPFNHKMPVFVKQHPRFDGSFKYNGKGGQLIKNLYGTPSGGYYYLEGMQKYLKANKYTQSQQDPSPFLRINNPTSFILIALCTDDFLVVATDEHLITALFTKLRKKYNVKRLGEPSQYLGWKIGHHNDGSVKISQPKYIDSILDRLRMTYANGVKTPYAHSTGWHPPTDEDDRIPESAEIYQSILGELRYIADSTRPDIVFAANKLATATKQSTKGHWALLKRLVRYLNNTRKMGIV